MVGPSLDSFGGIAAVENQLIRSLRSTDEFFVSFVPSYKDGSKIEKFVVAAKAYFQYLIALSKCDVTHVHMASRGSYKRKKLFIEAALRRNIPVVLHLHGGEFSLWFGEECNDLQRDEIRGLFRCCAAVVVLSEGLREYLIAENVCNSSQLHVIYNTVDLPSKGCMPRLHRDVLFLGRLDANKSPDVLLRASRKMLRDYPGTKLLFAGDGNLDFYKKIADDLGIGNRCEFLGWITGEEKEMLFNRVGMCCLPSKNEGMPMSVLEAMAHGIPIIATPVGGIPRVIDDGVNGYLVPVGDEEKLSELLCKLACSGELREKIGCAGRVTIADYFDIEKNSEILRRLYESLVF